MNNLDNIIYSVLDKIVPSEDEIKLIDNIILKLKTILDTSAKKLNLKYTKIESQGSTGIKQTQLKGDYDIDLFIGLDYSLFKPKYEGLSKNKLKKESKKDFLELCTSWIIKSLKAKEFKNPRLLYAEHPYVTVDYLINNTKIKIDIVLFFDLDLDYIKENGPITAVDRSPWHGRFVRDNLTLNQKNHVRLLKQFFKSSHCYGDKSGVGRVGFIGYSAELLIYYFGDLNSLFKQFDKLETTPLDYYNRSEKELNDIIHFQNDFLIIIDPIDSNRNVASAISKRAYKYCKYLIAQFLKKPSESYFILKDIPELDFSNFDKSKMKHFFIFELINYDENIHYTVNRDKLYSLADSVKATGEREHSHEERFGAIEFELYFNDAKNEYAIAFYVEHPNISETYLRQGPPLTEKYHTKKFKEKNPDFVIKDGYLWVETKRDCNDFLSFLSDYLNKNVPENFKIHNVSNMTGVKTSIAKKALYILKNMVLPFI